LRRMFLLEIMRVLYGNAEFEAATPANLKRARIGAWARAVWVLAGGGGTAPYWNNPAFDATGEGGEGIVNQNSITKPCRCAVIQEVFEAETRFCYGL
ncbi:MAG: hypothetical protein ACODAD_05590, partial [Planctomycetota bacterium]